MSLPAAHSIANDLLYFRTCVLTVSATIRRPHCMAMRT